MGNDGNQLSPDEGGTSKNGRGLLKVPSRSSSQQRNQASTASTGLSGATATDPRSSVDGRSKESRGSMPGRQRNGSASTHRSGGDSERDQNTLGNSQPSSPSTSDQKRRRKKNGGLLSLLGCCGVPDTATTLEEGESENVHKIEKLPQRPVTAKSRPQAAAEQQSGNPLNEKETGPTGTSPNNVENQASSSAQEPEEILSAEPIQTEFKQQPVAPVVVVDSPPHLSGNEVETREQTETRDNVDADMPDAGQEEAYQSPVPQLTEDPQSQTIPPPPPPPPSVPGPSVISPLTLTESNPSAPEPQSWLLPSIAHEHKGRKCLVLDLDETLVHSSFKILHQADFTIPVEIEGNYHNVYVIKRPGVDEFMKRVGELYEVVVFTASVSKYGDPLLDQLDIHKVIHHRLFRESCYNHQGNYVKDLSQIGRDLKDTIIIDNSPTSYIFHPQHAVPISSWFSDAHDNELLDLIPVLEDLAGPNVADVSMVLDVTL
ncbi:hypothetical protein C2857_002314 [Epichloe festucae Fl1]|uniref:FCP1 homology domain-containing protein n=1 Tax=Epichloe festucae (strain Fl1) TaxID=877507 RepID=A0A7S9PTP0_EPIFF|nr:hypothetical protein C2857_002314 [Epichloe festucae Fl1]